MYQKTPYDPKAEPVSPRREGGSGKRFRQFTARIDRCLKTYPETIATAMVMVMSVSAILAFTVMLPKPAALPDWTAMGGSLHAGAESPKSTLQEMGRLRQFRDELASLMQKDTLSHADSLHIEGILQQLINRKAP